MKKIFYTLTVIFICFLTFNCNNKKQNATLVDVSKNADSVNFDKFITEFSTNESFQFAHIKFPVEMFLPENEFADILKDTTLFISKKDWSFINLVDAEKFPTKEKVFFEREQYENGFLIVVKGKDSGILIEYRFVKQTEEDLWFLVYIEDRSM
jgi:hypothetical protein